ncbi:MAG: hypothetical protein M4579_005018 [Chaenotheca gracillima]|nr:MAG: hypothetical protein M4579_005018 [Chaenotheca gracillima]
MSRKTDARSSAVVAAKVSFLTLYNPSLGNTDETLHDQIVYYFSQQEQDTQGARSKGESGGGGGSASKDDVSKEAQEARNERLRQIGLAQGMVEFARGFSDGDAVDSVETEKSRIILHELERGWWILVSIDLTRLPSNKASNAKPTDSTETKQTIEYSAREVCPPGLLLQHLLRAHSIFLLHHAASLDELYVRVSRSKFCNALSLFWTKFIWNWDVLLHGNPAVDIFRGMKLAPGGELGIGVGEEEWGSGEREVLEGLVGRIDGMVDLVVSRFGDAPDKSKSAVRTSGAATAKQTWATSEARPGPSDGVVFSGVQAISRNSIRSLTSWTEWLYMYGEAAYGVQENPNSALRKRRRRPLAQTSAGSFESAVSAESTGISPLENPPVSNEHSNDRTDLSVPGIPPPIVSAAEASLKDATHAAAKTQERKDESLSPESNAAASSSSETFMKYLTLGYGSSWNFGGNQTSPDEHAKPVADAQEKETSPRKRPPKPLGSYLIGFKGDLENDDFSETEVLALGGSDAEMESRKLSSRIALRTVTVEVDSSEKRSRENGNDRNGSPPEESNSTGRQYKKLRVVVYMCQPFIFTFLFELRAPMLAISSFYRSIHQQLQPLQKPLLASTSPSNVTERLLTSGNGSTTKNNKDPIFDLIYDPKSLTVHSSIPNIPEPGAPQSGVLQTWTRVEALNVHTQILNAWASTQGQNVDLERTCKTSRGWWIVWMRLPASRDGEHRHHQNKAVTSDTESQQVAAVSRDTAYRQAFLVRKASDYEASSSSGRGGLGSWREGTSRGNGNGNGNTGGSWGPGKLADGIGVDTRKYIEGLLSLSR